MYKFVFDITIKVKAFLKISGLLSSYRNMEVTPTYPNTIVDGSIHTDSKTQETKIWESESV